MKYMPSLHYDISLKYFHTMMYVMIGCDMMYEVRYCIVHIMYKNKCKAIRIDERLICCVC